MTTEERRYNFEDFIENVLKLSETNHIYCPEYQKGQRGQCRNRNCNLIHIKLSTAVVCKHWLRGLCKKNEKCEFLHEYNLKKMPECFFFNVYGVCNNNDCLFLHLKPDSAARECVWYKRGFCKNGASCKNKHNRSVLCWDYYNGFCPNGPECKFGHPKFEIKYNEIQEEDIVKRAKVTAL
jgi:cleavage and polyadenylation specificity factor subunit 4